MQQNENQISGLSLGRMANLWFFVRNEIPPQVSDIGQ